MHAVIRAACSEWNLIHAQDPVNPDTSAWPRVIGAVDCWLRHACSNYDQERTDTNRVELQIAVRIAARRKYSWLRAETDPRTKACEPTLELTLTGLGRELNDIIEKRALLTRERSRTKDCAERKRIDVQLKELDRQSEMGRQLFKIGQTSRSTNGKRSLVVEEHTADRYLFGTRTLESNYINPTGITCVRCWAKVYVTKRPIDIGSGVKRLCWACRCMCVYGDGNSRVDQDRWFTILIDSEGDHDSRFIVNHKNVRHGFL
jgi:hypothetical protein